MAALASVDMHKAKGPRILVYFEADGAGSLLIVADKDTRKCTLRGACVFGGGGAALWLPVAHRDTPKMAPVSGIT